MSVSTHFFNYILNGGGSGGPYVFTNSEAEAVSNAAETVLSNAEKARVDSLVGALKTEGIWVKLTYFSDPGIRTTGNVPFNWINPAQVATAVGTPPVDEYGVSMVASNYFSTGRNWDTLVTQNNAMVGVWLSTDGQSGANIDITESNSGSCRLTVRGTSNAMTVRLNSAGTATASVANTSAVGLSFAQRISATQVQFFRNGSQLGTNITLASNAPVAFPLFFSSFGSPTNRRLNALIVGQFLTAGEHAAFNTAMTTYMTGKGVVAYTPPTTVALTQTSTTALPDIPGASPAGTAFTNTGLARHPSGDWLVADDGRYGTQVSIVGNWRPKLHRITPAGGLVSSIDLFALDGIQNTVQGVAVDNAGNYWLARGSGSVTGTDRRIQCISPAGALLANYSTFPTTDGPNGLAYDPARDRLYIAGGTSRDIIRIFDMAGNDVGPLVLPPPRPADSIDHMAVIGDDLWVTTGANGAIGLVRRYNLTQRTFTGMWSLDQATAIEGVFVSGSALTVCHDGYFHVVTPGVNQLQHYTLP